MYKIPPKSGRKGAPGHVAASSLSRLPFSEQLFVGWWLLHIPITLFVDLQGLLAPYYPGALRGLGLWWEEYSGDPFMTAGARGGVPWFRSFLLAEALFQLPLFFLFIREAFRPSPAIQMAGLIYAGHVCTTVYTIFIELFDSGNPYTKELSSFQLNVLLAAYTPYFVVPVLWAWRCWARLAGAIGRAKAQ
ncbi:hypothetical protein DFJ74DRAFT_695149 [Hyaloraphidium curvatum]|nr:hypothetical protein DFJ74DRAFT_695149 [Hyaloraphidium curvatum]